MLDLYFCVYERTLNFLISFNFLIYRLLIWDETDFECLANSFLYSVLLYEKIIEIFFNNFNILYGEEYDCYLYLFNKWKILKPKEFLKLLKLKTF